MTWQDFICTGSTLIVQSLIVELTDLVPWSLDSYGSVELVILFNGRELFRNELICLPGLLKIQPNSPIPVSCENIGFELANSRSLPAPGPRAYQFLKDEVWINAGTSRVAGVGQQNKIRIALDQL